MSWARVLALVFIVSFTISALLSMLILDELEESASARRVGPRASASLLRHSTLPPTAQQLAFRSRLHALHFGHQGATVLPSRRDAAGSKGAAAGGDAGGDPTDPAVQRRFVEGYEQLMQAAQSSRSPFSSSSLSPAALERAMLQSAGLGFSAESDGEYESHSPDLEEQFEGHYEGADESHADADADADDGGGDVSLLFGGGSSSLDGVSLWSLLWRGFGVDLASWDVDISNITHTWSKPNAAPASTPLSPPSPQSAQLPPGETAQSSEAQPQSQADGTPDATAPTDASIEATDGATPSSSPPLAPTRRPSRGGRSPNPSVSVLHDLLPHQGVQPYVSLSDNFSTAHLVLVHSYLAEVGAESGAPSKHDSRGDGLVEWFTRSARPFLFPMQSVSGAAAANAAAHAAAEAQRLHDPTLPQALQYITGFDIDLMMAMFAPVADLGMGGGGMGGGGHGNTPRRQGVEGDWSLHEYARVPGVVHASASTNGAGGSAEEEEWLVVAYEAEDPTQPDAEVGAVELLVFFQPNSTLPDASSQPDQDQDEQQAPAREAGVACQGSSSRVCLTIRLSTLRVVTALHVSSTRLDESAEADVVPLTILYSLRGDRRVFRSIEVRAEKGAEGGWTLRYEQGRAGPLAIRRGFISQTVSLQSYEPLVVNNGSAPSLSPSGLRPLRRGPDGALSVSPSKVVAAELNWARGPVTLAGAHASSSYNKWGIDQPVGTKQHRGRGRGRNHNRNRNAKQVHYLQNTPPYSAAVYTREQGAPPTANQTRESAEQNQSAAWERENWISSKKTEGKYGVDVHPLSIHRGNEGTLTPLVTAASANQRFVAFAQVPLITTVDGNGNYEPIEIIHLDADTAFTGLAFNNDGTIMAISDNHQDVIILRRSLDAANAKQTDASNTSSKASAGQPATPNATAEDATQAQGGSASVTEGERGDASSQQHGSVEEIAPGVTPVEADASEVPASPPSPPTQAPKKKPPASPPAPASSASAPRRRHSWEVMMEVVLPPKLRKLSMLSMQLVDVPVPPELLVTHKRTTSQKDPQAADEGAAKAAAGAAAAAPATNLTAAVPPAAVPVTTPVLVMLFQGGVFAAMQLTVIGSSGGAGAAAAPPPSTLASHFNHPPLAAQLSLDTLRAFFYVHWDLVLIMFIGTLWLLFSLPRFNRLAAQAQQGAQAQRPMAGQAQAPGGVRPRAFLRQMFFGDAAIRINAQLNNVVAPAAAVPPPPPQQQQQQQPAPTAAVAAPPMPNPLNPLAHVAQAAARSVPASGPAPAVAASSPSAAPAAPQAAPAAPPAVTATLAPAPTTDASSSASSSSSASQLAGDDALPPPPAEADSTGATGSE